MNPSWGVSVLFAVIAGALISVDVFQRHQEIQAHQELEAANATISIKTAANKTTEVLWRFNKLVRLDNNLNSSFKVEVSEGFFSKIKQGSQLTFNTPFNEKTYSVVLQKTLSVYPNIKSYNSRIINGEPFERVLISKGERQLQMTILSENQRYHVKINILSKQGVISLEEAEQVTEGSIKN